MKSISFLFVFLSLFFLSCTNEVKEISKCDYSLVLEYKDSALLPQQRFSFFTELSYDPRKVQSIELQDTQSDFKWKTEQFIKLINSDKKIVGFSNFVLPSNYSFNNGTYLVLINNFDKTSNTYYIILNFNKDLLKMSKDECLDYFNAQEIKKNLAIFDKEDTLIYFGEETEKLKTAQDIYLKYNQATYYNDVLFLDTMNVMCKMPSTKIQVGETNE